MKIKRIKKIWVNCFEFSVKWTSRHGGGSFNYGDREIEIGTRDNSDSELFMIICHELMEIAAVEMNVRLRRPDCDSDYIFVYDHRQHETMMNMASKWISEFLQ